MRFFTIFIFFIFTILSQASTFEQFIADLTNDQIVGQSTNAIKKKFPFIAKTKPKKKGSGNYYYPQKSYKAFGKMAKVMLKDYKGEITYASLSYNVDSKDSVTQEVSNTYQDNIQKEIKYNNEPVVAWINGNNYIIISSTETSCYLRFLKRRPSASRDFVVKANTLHKAYFDPEILSLKPDSFKQLYGRDMAMMWSSSNRRQLRTTAHNDICNEKTFEASAFFGDEGTLEKLSVSVFNKGDAKSPLSLNNFSKKVKKIKSIIDSELATKAKLKKASTLSKEKKSTYFWQKNKILYRLDYATTQKTPEYINLSLEAGDGKVTILNINSNRGKKVSHNTLRSKVVSKDNGDNFISGIPMVDQGAKGYCACAATARILQFYGRDVDQHVIAQKAGATKNGTNPEELKDALKKISGKFQIRFKELGDYPLSSQKNIQRFSDKLARTVLKPSVYKTTRKNIKKYERYGKDYNKYQLYQMYYSQRNTLIDRELKKMSREEVTDTLAIAAIKNDSKYRTFMRSIKSSIDHGRPLAWALMLGLVQEEKLNPQVRGGHMRLIIGYNEKTQEILFSDSWGPGHEMKRLKARDAYIPTMALWEISAR